MNKIKQSIKELIKVFGGNTTLNEVLHNINVALPHKCPKCSGDGFLLVKYDAYPTNLPDSGWASDIKTKKISCDVCDGEGYTEIKKEEITKVVGYR